MTAVFMQRMAPPELPGPRLSDRLHQRLREILMALALTVAALALLYVTFAD